ncbi:MAG: hypothetical protein QOJ85_1488 [Solirubrobacteraceae bacterium]|nr:hypothetical protein [Solirubrobacteraceae bacterium]
MDARSFDCRGHHKAQHMLTVLYEVGGVEEGDRRDPSGAPAAVQLDIRG